MAVALCVARATALLGAEPVKISVSLSPNMLKNAMGVGIPGTGRTGLPVAVALGAICGDPSRGLLVLDTLSDGAVERADNFVSEGRVRYLAGP